MKKIVLTICVALAFASCSLQKQSIQEAHTEARFLPIDATSQVTPLSVDIAIDNVAGKVKDVWKFSPEQIDAMGGDITNIKARGLYLSTQKHDVDIIVAPIFNLESINEKGKEGWFELTIIGYLGRFTNWQNGTK